eukprot:3647198-Rhodomonas_salina.1
MGMALLQSGEAHRGAGGYLRGPISAAAACFCRLFAPTRVTVSAYLATDGQYKTCWATGTDAQFKRGVPRVVPLVVPPVLTRSTASTNSQYTRGVPEQHIASSSPLPPAAYLLLAKRYSRAHTPEPEPETEGETR